MTSEGADRRSTWCVFRGDALDAYAEWPTPSAIISDGAYGVGGFPGDPRTTDGLADWYEPHVEAWSKHTRASSTLWFWNTELGWATVHPVLVRHGWEYVQTIVWDKGIAHIAGNVNGDTIRRFPVVTEVCVFYRRRLEFPTPDGIMPAKRWLRYEWQRAGLRLQAANQACGVANAATRKYLTQDWLWYFPPPEMMERLVSYANEHGRPDGAPYYSLDGEAAVTAEEWATLRDVWSHTHGVHQRLGSATPQRRRALQGQPSPLRPACPPTGPQRRCPPQPEAAGLHAPDRHGRYTPRRCGMGALWRAVQRRSRCGPTRPRRLCGRSGRAFR